MHPISFSIAAQNWQNRIGANSRPLELGACRTEIDETGGEWTAGGLSREDAEFFTVYARNHDGEAEAITDIDTYLGGCLILAELVRISDLGASFSC
ncbi:hypothetical protein ACFSE0_11155 [Ochrobactrum teleogrylli]|uniref:Uncharacterized protein n=1 Tax=Ochrobactrum teleogrylli TaxID=2479765 RepID=A0ABY2XZV8_9HYPH|nr:hypothetical protein [[Ochrobactrum] teleogrylli]TNV09313.1 hypothetical protein FIC94_22120 [[Ochrobactrum] teleogrylli]